MSCLSLLLPIPQIPPIFIPDPSFVETVDFGQAGVTCCLVTLPAFQLPLTLPLFGQELLIAIMAVNALIQAGIVALTSLLTIPNCPMNGAVI